MKITPEIMANAVLCDSGRYYYHSPNKKRGEWLKYVDACPACGNPFLSRGHTGIIFDKFCDRECSVAFNKRKIDARVLLTEAACAQWKKVVQELSKGQREVLPAERGAMYSAPVTSGIYQIVNSINGKVYVGSTIQLAVRWASHRTELCKGTHRNEHLQHAWNKYGEDAFGFSVIELIEDRAQLLIREQLYLDALLALGCGYNISPTAGSTLGRQHKEETKRKISEKTTGHKMSEENKRKLSAANKGKTYRLGCKVSAEVSRAMGERRRGSKHTEEAKGKMSVAQKAWRQEKKENPERLTRAQIKALRIANMSSETHE